jgi:ribonuclease HII
MTRTRVISPASGCSRELEESLRIDGYGRIAGVDEVGRGPLAGPVVAAAVVLKLDAQLPDVTDSKLLDAEQRRALLPQIRKQCDAIGTGLIDPGEIDRINILQATFAAMRRALAATRADCAIVEGRHTVPECHLPQVARVKADRTSLCVAAASIVAKVIRDDIMVYYGRKYPDYCFEQHKGYATRGHFAALDRYGPCAIHRQSFLVRWRERRAQASLKLGL